MEGHVFGADVYRAAAALGHLEAVAQQGEARHIGAAVDAVFHHDVPRRLVQRGHLAVDAVHHAAVHQSRFGGGGQYAHAQRLGQNQHVAGLRAAVGQDAAGMHETGHRQTVDRFRAVNGVAAGDDDASLIGLVIAAPQQLLHHIGGHGLGDAHDVQRQLRLAAHGVYVADGIGRGDLPIQEGIVHDRREEIRGLHQRRILVQIVHAGVVGFVKAHQQPRVAVGAEALQQLHQRSRAHLRAASGAGGQLCQFYFCFHGQPSASSV